MATDTLSPSLSSPSPSPSPSSSSHLRLHLHLYLFLAQLLPSNFSPLTSHLSPEPLPFSLIHELINRPDHNPPRAIFSPSRVKGGRMMRHDIPEVIHKFVHAHRGLM